MRISENISAMLNSSGIINKNEAELCKYGLDSFIATFIEIAAILILSVALNNVVETVLLFLTFIPLRVYAGGYHADTRLRCFLISLLVYAMFTLSLKFILMDFYELFIFGYVVISMIVIFCFSPVVHKNKKVNDIERKNYRKFSIIIALLEIIIIAAVLIVSDNNIFALSLASGQMAAIVSMIMALLKDRITANK